MTGVRITGKNHWTYGKKLSKEHIEKLRLSHLGNKPLQKTKLKMSKAHKKHWSKPENLKKISDAHKGKKLSKEHIKNLCIAAKKRWSNKEYIEKLRKSMKLKPNTKEKILINLFKEHNLDYCFVGDFSFIIERKNPDFVNCNGQKKIIELFGDYWHNNSKTKYHQTEKGTKEHYAKYGWKTLVIWEKELKDIDGVLKKVTRFDKL